MSQSVKVAIAGVNGKMGRCSVTAVAGDDELEFTGAFGREDASYVGSDLSKFLPGSQAELGVKVSRNFKECIASDKPDVLLEFTRAESAMAHAKLALENGIHPLIGTSGLNKGDLEELDQLCRKANLGAMHIPNFSIGAVLMMEFAAEAGKHFGNVEVVEMHGVKKLDAPSGTAMYTADKLSSGGKSFNEREVEEKELLKGARGAVASGNVRVHSLRLPGLISHQDVVFGSVGELLEIRHASFNSDCFLAGIRLAAKKIVGSKNFSQGLDKLL